jgi:hypothetical protein
VNFLNTVNNYVSIKYFSKSFIEALLFTLHEYKVQSLFRDVSYGESTHYVQAIPSKLNKLFYTHSALIPEILFLFIYLLYVL